ncbi:DUF1642 domain-containing protein [Streptococcus suis]|uniref:DUF1642 domain-containing protein n=1 Tax=Streptococcus suis TaxID=1307 RepID=UPI001ABE6604|nr:DUF1642 domain-containing protein [Streptococcus suis]
MNIQEAIEELKKYKVGFGEAAAVRFDRIVSVITQIHEPQKVVVPKFVAEWIEECKRSGWHLQKVLSNLDDDEKVGDWAYDGNDDLIPEKVEMIARAWLDGFEIEQEKLYTVELFNRQPLVEANNVLYFSSNLAASNAHVSKDKLEKAGFGWVFDCSGVKVVEAD